MKARSSTENTSRPKAESERTLDEVRLGEVASAQLTRASRISMTLEGNHVEYRSAVY